MDMTDDQFQRMCGHKVRHKNEVVAYEAMTKLANSGKGKDTSKLGIYRCPYSPQVRPLFHWHVGHHGEVNRFV